MPGDSRLVTENFLRLNFTPKSGITPGTNDTLHMSCDQILSRYSVAISGVTTTGARLPGQNQLSSSLTTPTVTTAIVTYITDTTATAGGTVTDGGDVTARGVCYGTSLNPTISGNYTTDGSGSGTFSSSITGLSTNTKYYVRAYATVGSTTYYGDNEELHTSSYYTSGYGKLYNQYAAKNSRNIASSNWKLPTRSELDELISDAGGGTIAGGRLKQTGTSHWMSPNTGASNYYSFNAVGSGFIDKNTSVGALASIAEYWAVEDGVVMVLQYNSEEAYTGTNVPVNRGCSIVLLMIDSSNWEAGDLYTGNDGKTYATVMINDKVWLAEPLKETQYRDNTTIPEVQNMETWTSLTSGAYHYFNNNSSLE